MKPVHTLLRDTIPIAQGRVSLDLSEGIALFSVATWLKGQCNAFPWAVDAVWSLSDGKRERVLPGKAIVVGVGVDGQTLVTLTLACSSESGPLMIDVRDDPDR